MRKILQNAKAAIITLFACFGIFASSVYAADSLKVAIPFSIEVSGNTQNVDESYIILLRADDASVPMPEGSEDGIYEMKVQGGGNFTFPEITYTAVGIYSYTMEQESGRNELCTYDTAVYDITVYITNALDGSGLEATTVAYRQGEADEKSYIVFTNEYETPIPPVDITVVKKWADDGENRPASVTVQLLKDGEVYETVTLSEENTWSYTWRELSGEFEWTIVESDIPKGYSASYSQNNGVITITNTESLIQTGQLTWPIPVLVCMGVAMLVLGGILLFKDRKNENA